MASGVPVDQEVLDEYNKLKLSGNTAPRYLQCVIDNNRISVEKKGPRSGDCEADFKQLYSELTSEKLKNECRFILFDVHAQASESEGLRTKIVFIMWAPDTAAIKKKMLLSSSKGNFKSALGDSGMPDLQATDAGELTWDELKGKALKQ